MQIAAPPGGIRVELQQRVLPHGKMTLKLGTLESRCMRVVNPNPYQDCSVFGLEGKCSYLSQAGGGGRVGLCLCLRRIPCCYLGLIYENLYRSCESRIRRPPRSQLEHTMSVYIYRINTFFLSPLRLLSVGLSGYIYSTIMGVNHQTSLVTRQETRLLSIRTLERPNRYPSYNSTLCECYKL